jgi:heterotetrameric sarcosine oxidase gamma subunit
VADQPVARSAIAVPEQATSGEAGVSLTDRSNWFKVLVHHHGGSSVWPDGVEFGKVVSVEGGGYIVGWAPGQTLIMSDVEPSAVLAGIPDADEQVNVSHGYTLFSIEGTGAVATLAKLCAIDLSERTQPGTLARTSVAKVATGVIKLDADPPSFLLMCDRSYGRYLFDEILVAAAEFGVATEDPAAL